MSDMSIFNTMDLIPDNTAHDTTQGAKLRKLIGFPFGNSPLKISGFLNGSVESKP